MTTTKFVTRIAENAEDMHAAQRLRYQVFVNEMGANGHGVDHENQRETDEFDDHATHLILLDISRPTHDQVVGAYRLIDQAAAAQVGRFYSQSEFDLGPLLGSGRRILEAGRSCLHPAYRNGAALHLLWSELARYVVKHGYDVLFGVASYPTNDVSDVTASLSYLAHHYHATGALQVQSLDPDASVAMAPADRLIAMRQTPSLIKAYLRLGGRIGRGYYIDKDFGTIDVCMVLDVQSNASEIARLIARDI